MRTRYSLILILTLLQLAGCKSGAKGPQGLVLYQPLDAEGKPAPELIVVDPDGEEQHRISLSDPIVRGFVTRAGHRALVGTFDGQQYLVDAKQGTAQALELPAEATLLGIMGGGERWTFMGDRQSGLAFLVDLETAQVHPVAALSEGVPISFGWFGPGEERLMLFVGTDAWLIPTTDPDRARRLGTGKSVYTASFSSDGTQVVYVQRTEADDNQVLIEPVDGSESELVTSGSIRGAVFAPNNQKLVLLREDKASLLSLGDGEEKELLAYSGLPFPPRSAFNNSRVLFGHMPEDLMTWHLIDPKEETAQSLPDLDGFQNITWDPRFRWLFFDETVEGTERRRFVGLDLESGETHLAMELNENSPFPLPIISVSSDGKFMQVNARSEDNEIQLWLLRADGGEPRLLAEGVNAHGTFSPDGDWVAVSTTEKIGDERKARLTLMEIEGEETRSLGEGIRPLWVRSSP